MNLPYRGETLLIGVWIIVISVPPFNCTDGSVIVSKEDVLVLKDEDNPKCFTRTQYDFTCFFETSDNRTYDLFYMVSRQKRCETSIQRTVEGAFLHICTFPAADVLLYVEIHISVVERDTNTSMYKRAVCVEDHFLLDPPLSVSLDHNGQPGQLQVSWQTKAPRNFEDNLMYMIWYSSRALGEKTSEVKEGDILDSAVPGEKVEVQIAVKCALNPHAGHWSRWSQPVQEVVPQSADDISLMCYTSDLQNVICQWNGTRYGLEKEYKPFYRTALSKASSWSNWAECLADLNITDMCSFKGDAFQKLKVKLCSTASLLSRTFYTREFTMNTSIRTSPPSDLKGVWEESRLCLKWDAPLPSLSSHLQYEIGYQVRLTVARMMMSTNGPETSTCVEVPLGSRYSARIRAKPTGPIYSGDWSDWSDILTGDTPADRGIFLLLCIPTSMLMAAIIFILLFLKFFSKLKLYFWPPVPNLEKVLQGYLMEINGQRWDPPLTAKQCFEDTPPSVVEILSADELAGLEKPSETRFYPPPSERSRCNGVPADETPASEVCPDYVTLNKDSIVHCPKENMYVHNRSTHEKGVTLKDELLASCCDDSASNLLCPGNEFINQSYLPQAEPADGFNCKAAASRGTGNLYTNLPCS